MKVLKRLLFFTAYSLIVVNGLLAVILVGTAFVLSPILPITSLLLVASIGFSLTLIIAFRLQNQSKHHFAQLWAALNAPIGKLQEERPEPLLSNNY